MRTLAGTFSTRNEAEAASRRLQAIGIPGDRIILKDVAATAEAGPGAAGAAFISVKVTTDQVEPVSEILKGRWTGTPAADPAASLARSPSAAPANAEPSRSFAPAGRDTPSAAPLPNVAALAAKAAAVAAPPHDAPVSAAAREREKARLGRNLILFALALVGAFMIGAWLGLLSG